MMKTSSHNAIFVDTSGWAEPILQSTPRHAEMDAFSRTLLQSRRPNVTTDDILGELVALITSRSSTMPRSELIRFINRIRALLQVTVIHIDEQTFLEAWTLLEQAQDKEWSLVDAASFLVMWRLSILEAFTSDHHFAQAGFMPLPLVTP